MEGKQEQEEENDDEVYPQEFITWKTYAKRLKANKELELSFSKQRYLEPTRKMLTKTFAVGNKASITALNKISDTEFAYSTPFDIVISDFNDTSKTRRIITKANKNSYQYATDFTKEVTWNFVCINNHIITGRKSVIEVYDITTCKLVQEINIFNHNALNFVASRFEDNCVYVACYSSSFNSQTPSERQKKARGLLLKKLKYEKGLLGFKWKIVDSYDFIAQKMTEYNKTTLVCSKLNGEHNSLYYIDLTASNKRYCSNIASFSFSNLPKKGEISCVAITSKYLAFGSTTSNLIFLFRSSKQKFELAGHTKPVESIIRLKETNRFLSCSKDNTIRMWEDEFTTCICVVSADFGLNRIVELKKGFAVSSALAALTKTSEHPSQIVTWNFNLNPIMAPVQDNMIPMIMNAAVSSAVQKIDLTGMEIINNNQLTMLISVISTNSIRSFIWHKYNFNELSTQFQHTIINAFWTANQSYSLLAEFSVCDFIKWPAVCRAKMQILLHNKTQTFPKVEIPIVAEPDDSITKNISIFCSYVHDNKPKEAIDILEQSPDLLLYSLENYNNIVELLVGSDTANMDTVLRIVKCLQDDSRDYTKKLRYGVALEHELLHKMIFKHGPTTASHTYALLGFETEKDIFFEIGNFSTDSKDYSMKVRQLIKFCCWSRSLDINMLNSSNQTLLHIALLNENDELVKALLEHFARVDISDNAGINALALSRFTSNSSIRSLVQQASTAPTMEVTKYTYESILSKYKKACYNRKPLHAKETALLDEFITLVTTATSFIPFTTMFAYLKKDNLHKFSLVYLGTPITLMTIPMNYRFNVLFKCDRPFLVEEIYLKIWCSQTNRVELDATEYDEISKYRYANDLEDLLKEFLNSSYGSVGAYLQSLVNSDTTCAKAEEESPSIANNYVISTKSACSVAENQYFVPIDKICFHTGAVDSKVVLAEYAQQKIELKQVSTTEERINEEKFVKSLEIIAGLQHDSMVKVLGFTTKPYRLLLAHSSGGSLHDFLQSTSSHSMTWEQRKNIVLQLSLGLQYLHKRIIHGAITSTNVHLDGDSNAKWINFGLSAVIPTYVLNTANYMAPELITSSSVGSRAADMYSFGMLVHEIITGKHPRNSLSPMKVVNEVIYNNNYDNDIASDMPDLFKAILRSCWRKDPKKRPSATTIVAALKDEKLSILKADIPSAEESKCSNSTSTNSTNDARGRSNIPEWRTATNDEIAAVISNANRNRSSSSNKLRSSIFSTLRNAVLSDFSNSNIVADEVANVVKVDNSSEEFKRVEKIVIKSTTKYKSQDFKVNLIGVERLNHNATKYCNYSTEWDEEEGTQNTNATKPRVHVFHGTRESSLKSVCENGLKLPQEAGALGKAIYFSPSISTALWYSHPELARDWNEIEKNGHNNTVKVLLCTVFTSYPLRVAEYDPLVAAKMKRLGCDSVMLSALNSVSSSLDEELAIYDEKQVEITHLLELRYQWRLSEQIYKPIVDKYFMNSANISSAQFYKMVQKVATFLHNSNITRVHFEGAELSYIFAICQLLKTRTISLLQLSFSKSCYATNYANALFIPEIIRTNAPLAELRLNIFENQQYLLTHIGRAMQTNTSLKILKVSINGSQTLINSSNTQKYYAIVLKSWVVKELVSSLKAIYNSFKHCRLRVLSFYNAIFETKDSLEQLKSICSKLMIELVRLADDANNHDENSTLLESTITDMTSISQVAELEHLEMYK